MSTMRFGILAIVCPLALACSAGLDESETAARVETLENGGVHARNPAVGSWAEGENWRLVEELRIGSRDGPGPDVFGSIGSLTLAVNPEGRMLVMDGQANRVQVFDRSGAHVGSFGGGGSGPGEFQSAYIAGWSPENELWIVDPGNARYGVFSADGEWLGSHAREVGFFMSPWPGLMDSEGRVLDVGIRGRDRVLVRVDARAATADTFPLPNYQGGQFQILNSAGLPMMGASIPFAGQLVWHLDPRGYVWSAMTDRYRIVQQNLAGDTLLIVERASSPVPVTAAERNAALETLEWFLEAGGQIDASRIPSVKPLINGLTVDDRGNIWVLPHPSSEAEPIAYDVFDPDGRYLGAVPTSTPLSFWGARPVFRGNHVYGFTLDDLGIPFLVRLRIDGREPTN